MKASNLHTKHILAGLLPILLLFGLFCVVPLAFALPSTQDQSPESSEQQKQPAKTLFNYAIENRPDPFVSFISAKKIPTNLNEIVPVTEILSGMQLFEPGQLNLVAIVFSDNSDFAMVEDTTGKGYILTAGMKIGERGVVTAIQPNEVIIEEISTTRAKKKINVLMGSTVVIIISLIFLNA